MRKEHFPSENKKKKGVVVPSSNGKRDDKISSRSGGSSDSVKGGSQCLTLCITILYGRLQGSSFMESRSSCQALALETPISLLSAWLASLNALAAASSSARVADPQRSPRRIRFSFLLAALATRRSRAIS